MRRKQHYKLQWKREYIFQRLARECEDVLHMSGGRVTRTSLSAAKFTSAAIRESLRLHPVAVAFGRELNKVGTLIAFTRGSVLGSDCLTL